MKKRLEQKARNEGLIREVNERIERVDRDASEAGWVPEGGRFEFLCECGRGEGACEATIEMTIEEYEHVREQDDRFAVHPGHADERLERVIERNDRFALVDKRPSAEPLVDDDPRGATSA
jgi:hypothetical protein